MTASRSDAPLPAYMTVSAHIRQLGLSRARFYVLMGNGFFIPPVYLLVNRRPVYTPEMAEKNALAKAVGIGVVSGEARVFYQPRRDRPSTDTAGPRRSRRSLSPGRRSQNDIGSIVAALGSLGLQGVEEDVVAQIITDLFPEGTGNVENGDVIRAVFRRVRQQQSV